MKITINKKKLKEILLMPTPELMLYSGGQIVDVSVSNKEKRTYCYLDRGSTVLGVGHCDSVTCGSSHVAIDKNLVFSTRLDDRLGVFVLLELLPQIGIELDILLTDHEESGQSTAKDFTTEKKYNWLVEFDRRGSGCVCYDYDEMEDIAAEYFKEVDWGSFSDISYLEHMGVCGLNVGTAYYNEHSIHSYARLDELVSQIKAFSKMYHDLWDIEIPHTEKPSRTYGFHNDGGWPNKYDKYDSYDEYWKEKKPLVFDEIKEEHIEKCDWCGEWEYCDDVDGHIVCEMCLEFNQKYGFKVAK